MKRRFKLLTVLVLIVTMLSTVLTGCSSLKTQIRNAVTDGKNIKTSVDGETYVNKKMYSEWVELDSLDSFKNIRKEWDDKFNIVAFDTSSKNGVLFIDLNGNWAGNNVLFNIFQNKVFVNEYWSNNKLKSDLAQVAMEQFSDIKNESTGIIASINAYFNIIPANEDGTSGLLDVLSRAEAMSAIYKGDTPVIYSDENEEFKKAVGENKYNKFAFNVTENSYLDFKNGGLNYDTYNGAMTRAEAIYILMNRYFKDELDTDETLSKTSLADCKNAGKVADKLKITDKHAWQSYELEYCLQNKKDGAPESLYRAMVLANKLSVVSTDTKWSKAITGGELLNMMIKCYQAKCGDDYLVNAKTGQNAGQTLYIEYDDSHFEEQTEEELGGVNIREIRDVTELDELFKVYGNEIDMTDEEIKEAYEIADKYTFTPCDKWMQVDYCSYLNVRTGPSTDYRILRSVPQYTKAHIVARCNENGWYRVVTEGKIVYQCGVYFSDFEGSETYEPDNK